MMLGFSSVSVTPIAADDDTHGHEEESSQAGMMALEREHMFDKVVTPSDVGKLNRLVIPKQHAERCFPLDSSTNDKGLLLNFEDRNGKLWRFRYSYWNSSQSYVMTKGWSRFVKEKKLDAGDIVSFQRGVGVTAKDRLFIDWRRRLELATPPYQLSSLNLSFPLARHNFSSLGRYSNINVHPWNPLILPPHPAPTRSHSNFMLQHPNSQPSSYTLGSPYNISNGSVVNLKKGGSGSFICFRPGGYGTPQQQVQMVQMPQRSGFTVGLDPPLSAAASPTPPAVVVDSLQPVHGKASAKRLRLFGVNMDCPFSEDKDDQDYERPSKLIPTTVSTSSTTNPIPMGHYNYTSYHHGHLPPPLSPPSSSTIPFLQLRPYGGGT